MHVAYMSSNCFNSHISKQHCKEVCNTDINGYKIFPSRIYVNAETIMHKEIYLCPEIYSYRIYILSQVSLSLEQPDILHLLLYPEAFCIYHLQSYFIVIVLETYIAPRFLF